jgi:protein translocase SEC61 complex gamma subunit
MVDVIESSQRIQDRIETWLRNRRRGKYMRVLRLAVRPDNEEFSNTLKLTFAGLLLLGFAGFAIQMFVLYATDVIGALWGG